jgi:hypothetical protein
MQLSATIASVYNSTLAPLDRNDIPTTVDAVVTNPDGARIQAALNNCSTNNPGEAVELSMDSTGTYNAFLSGPLSMPSNVTLLVDPGVTLFFSRNAQDYDYVSGTHTCGTRSSAKAELSCHPLIDIPGTSTNVGIMGYGKLNGRANDVLINAIAPYQGYSWWQIAAGGDQQNPRMIEPETGSSNITLYKITMQNSPYFHVSSGGGSVNGLTAWDVKIESPTYTANTDGIDPDQAQNVTVTESWISDGDDDIAVGSSGAAGGPNTAANISITNNHFFTGHGESIGSNTSASVTNVLFDNNMTVGDGFSGHGSSINLAGTIGTTKYAAHYANSSSTAVRIKSDQAAGGIVTNVQYSNSCFLDHHSDLLFTPLYNTDSGSDTPNVYGILLENLAFLNDDNSSGTIQFTGTDTVVSGTTYIYPLGVTLSNVTFPSALTASGFTNSGSSGKEQYANLTYGPGDVSNNFISDYATFVAVSTNHDTVTNNITATSLNPPNCNFTYIAPELTGPKGLPQTITYGQAATAVVILTPAVGNAAFPTGTVTLTDELTNKTTQATLSGTNDTIFVSLPGLGAGTHPFIAAYSGDSNYTSSVPGQPYSTAGPYDFTVNPAPLTVTANNASMPVGGPLPTFTASYSGFENGDTASALSGAPAFSTTATTSSPAGLYPITVTQGSLSDPNYTFSFVAGTLSVVQAPAVSLSTTSSVSGSAGSGYTLTITVKNNGTSTVNGITLNSATLGSASGAPVPQSLGGTGVLAAGASNTFTVSVPGSAGANGAGVAEKYSGTVTGGSFSGSIRSVTLP